MNALIQPGRILAGRYRIDQQIGVGGMAVVYRATDLNTQHFVAVKVLKPEYNQDAEYVARFQREAEAASKMTHHNIVNLLDMGVESYLIADALTGIIAQRLVRRLCPNCKRRHVLLEHELEYLGLTPEEKDSAEVYEPVGCQRCAGTGYFDRIGIYEIMEITPRMRTMISHRCDTGALRETAIAEGMHTLRESARRLVLEGTTSISEMADEMAAMMTSR